MATTYNTAIRQQLNKSGVDNSRIGFSNGYVTVDGKNFIQPTTTTNGTAYTSSSAFNNALKNVTTAANNAATTGNKLSTAASTASTIAKSLSVPSQSGKTTSTSTMTQTAPTPAWTPPVSQTQQTLNQISQQLAKQQQTQFKAPEAFNYSQSDLQNDPQYQAQLALAQRNIARQQYDTNALLRAGGQGKSSYSEIVANQVGADALANISDTIVPQIIAQAYNQYNDAANRSLEVQKANYGVGQDYLQGLGNQYTNQNQEYFQNPITQAQTTGTLQTADVRDAVNQLVAIKQQAEAKGITKDARSSLSETANQIRDYLRSRGVDTSGLEATTASGKIDASNVGVRTLQAQQLDQQAAQNRVQNAIAVGDQTGRVVTPQMDQTGLWRQAANRNAPLTLAAQQQAFNQQYQTNRANVQDQQWQSEFGYKQDQDNIANQQWQQQFNQNVKQFGANYALQRLEFDLNRQVQNGQLSIQDAENARAQAKFEAEQSASGQVNVNEVASKYLDPVIKIDPNTGIPVDQEAAKRQIASIAGGDSNLAAQLYLRYGMKPTFDYSPQ